MTTNQSSLIRHAARVGGTSIALLALHAAIAPLAAQTAPTLHYACYVPLTGTVYRIKEPGLKPSCTAPHIEFSWNPQGGPAGPTGPQGPSGNNGAAGATGPAGPTGPQGIAGQNGAPGTTGPQGAPGRDGVNGTDGQQGPTGPQGPAGTSGSNGTAGAAGPTGPAGNNGTDGAAGATGPAGPTGPVGPIGPTGPAGSGVTNHAALTGLNNDDHAQYLLTSGARVSTGFAVVGLLTGGGTSALLWQPNKGAFRVGSVDGAQWNDAVVGLYSLATGRNATASGQASTAMGTATQATNTNSTAMGNGTQATGLTSTAMGNGTQATGRESTAMGLVTTASGFWSTAMGHNTRASGSTATAMGDGTTASGSFSTAMGSGTTASGEWSTAMGFGSRASGDFSTAIGANASTNGFDGSFVYGDASTTSTVTFVNATARDQFVVRASGGFRLRTASDLSTGCDLPAGSGTFACTSDRNRKENFEAVDGESVLDRIARMPIMSWSYITEKNGVRHMGPTAQDFRAAFELGIDDLTISTVDIDGVNLAAVKALELRTAKLATENAALRSQDAALKAELARLRADIDALQKMLTHK